MSEIKIEPIEDTKNWWKYKIENLEMMVTLYLSKHKYPKKPEMVKLVIT